MKLSENTEMNTQCAHIGDRIRAIGLYVSNKIRVIGNLNFLQPSVFEQTLNTARLIGEPCRILNTTTFKRLAFKIELCGCGSWLIGYVGV